MFSGVMMDCVVEEGKEGDDGVCMICVFGGMGLIVEVMIQEDFLGVDDSRVIRSDDVCNLLRFGV